MKLFYVANARIPTEKAHGGAIMRMCEAFAKAKEGIEVKLILPKRFNRIIENPFTFYKVEANFKLLRLPSVDLVMLGNIGYQIQSLSFALSTLLYCLCYPADVYYGRDELSLFLLSFFKRNVFWEAHVPKKGRMVRNLLRRAKGVVVISSGLKDYYSRIGGEELNITVAPSGVNVEAFTDAKVTQELLRAQFNLPAHKKIIAYVGKVETMGVEKGVEGLKEAFARVARSYPEAYLLIVSDVSPLSVPLYMKSADILVMNYPFTEHYAHYMSPLKLFEYMASGVPMVVPDLPSIREVVNNKMALFFKAGDIDGLANAILNTLQENVAALHRAALAKKDVEQYSWQKRADRIITLLT